MISFTKEQIILLHNQLTAETGGSNELRDEGLLEAAISVPFQSFDGTELFPTVIEKATLLGFGLVSSHPFVDGNKRIGAHAMLLMLSLNKIKISYTRKELSEIILSVASGNKNYEELLYWVKEHTST